MRIIVDAFGGDNAPLEVLKGAAQAVSEYGHTVVLSGNEQTIRQVAQDNAISLDNMEILDCDDVMTMHDEPKSILRAHKNSSMAVGLKALADGQGEAFVSAGSTGALLVGGTFIVKRIKGVSRPAIGAVIPSNDGPVLLVDSGANVEVRPSMLQSFAQMGSVYMNEVLGIDKPRVGLLNVGTEEEKGGDLQKETFALLKTTDVNFIGNIEARQVPYGDADVVVADGFSGNVLLKTMEGTVDVLLQNIKGIFKSNLLTLFAALLVKSKLGDFKKRMSTDEQGGAPLLGIQKPVIKTHGNAKAVTIKNAIRVAADCASAGVIEKIAAAVASNEGQADDE